MPRGDKSAYSGKQKRQAEHIEEGYEDRGRPKEEAERIAWATVNKESGGGKQSGSGRAGDHQGEGSSHRSASQRSDAAKRGWETRRKKDADK